MVLKLIILLIGFAVPGITSTSISLPVSHNSRIVPWARTNSLMTEYNPVAVMTTPEIIAYHGYKGESHRVMTKDGYFNTLHRIGKHGSTPGKRVILLQHGVLGSSAEWLLNRPGSILPFKLADNGYDVFLGNARGNRYSKGHVNLTTHDIRFWDFSFNEMGKYDIPAAIDYILGLTGVQKLYYLGFSMGTSQFWIMMHYHPEYNEKVHLFVALAPVVYLKNIEGAARILTFTESVSLVREFANIFLNGELFPPWITALVRFFGIKYCANREINMTICSIIAWLYFGVKYANDQEQSKQLHAFFGHVPSSTSFRTGMHLLQFIQRDYFRNYDFGKAGNMRRYGTPDPPLYDLSKTTVPTALFYGANDAVVAVVDVERLKKELGSVIVSATLVNSSTWNHFGYHIARDANELVHTPLLKMLEGY